MNQTLLPTDDSFKARFRNILMLQRLRRPLAVAGIFLSLFALAANVAQVDLMLRPVNGGAETHPTTSVCMLILCIGLLHFRPQVRPPRWRVFIGYCGLGFLLLVLAGHTLGENAAGEQRGTLPFGAMGTDTALILSGLFIAVLARRCAGKVALSFAVLSFSLLICDFITLSYGKDLFEGQMAATTVLALVPVNLAILTLFAHRPLLRVVFLAGQVGVRTRLTMVAGFVVPWLGGMILHWGYGVPDRTTPVEAIITALICLGMACVAVVSGHFHEKVDLARRRLSRQLAHLATVDQLTNALNRTGIMRELDRRWQIFQDIGRDQSVILLDLDHFKSVNDRLGHDAGDRVLSAVTHTIRPHLRRGDVIGRWGGEEFLIIVDGVKASDTMELAERLRKAVARIPTTRTRTADPVHTLHQRVTASFGVGSFQAADDAPSAAIKRADLALYDAKEKGRNQVVLGPREQPAAA